MSKTSGRIVDDIRGCRKKYNEFRDIRKLSSDVTKDIGKSLNSLKQDVDKVNNDIKKLLASRTKTERRLEDLWQSLKVEQGKLRKFHKEIQNQIESKLTQQFSGHLWMLQLRLY
jgi:septal ring factor EnvC (AmiA/AmiB activator)